MNKCELANLLSIDTKNLKKKQLDAYIEFVSNRLLDTAKLIRDKKFDEVIQHLAYSPAGDEMGDSSHYIDFSLDDTPRDLMETIQALKGLEE